MGLMDKNPELALALGGLGRGLSSMGRGKYGRGFDTGNMLEQLAGMRAEKAQGEKMAGLMGNMGMNPQQQAVYGAMPPNMQAQIAMGQAFPQGGGDPAVWRQKKNEMVRMGIPENVASGIATGQYRGENNPVTGNFEVTDMASGQPVYGQPAQPAPPPPPSQTLYERAGETTGVVSGAEALSTATLGQLPGAVGEFFSFPETVKDRQVLSAASGALVRALSVNSRYPVGEMTRIREEVGISPSIFDSETNARAKMDGVRTYLENLLVDERAAAGNAGLPSDRQQDALSKVQAIESFLRMMGGPSQQFDPAQYDSLPTVADQAGFDALNKGDYYRGADGNVRQK